ncbi:hypothetical protein Q3G72_003651 [Acer saccharum]|nr:hypothetical protein Q3G72_003651 [Acer saccharum]
MEIHKCGKDESGKEAMGFPSLITHFCAMAGVDLSAEEMKKPLVDLGIHTWYTLYPSRGLSRPGRQKRARTVDADANPEAEGSYAEAEGSELEVEDLEPEDRDVEMLSEDDESWSRWSRMLSALKLARKMEKKERSTALASQKEQIRAAKEKILREISASEGRVMAEISGVEDGFMQDFAKLRMELHVALYTRFLKEQAERKARAADPLGRGKGKLPGTS